MRKWAGTLCCFAEPLADSIVQCVWDVILGECSCSELVHAKAAVAAVSVLPPLGTMEPISYPPSCNFLHSFFESDIKSRCVWCVCMMCVCVCVSSRCGCVACGRMHSHTAVSYLRKVLMAYAVVMKGYLLFERPDVDWISSWPPSKPFHHFYAFYGSFYVFMTYIKLTIEYHEFDKPALKNT